MAKKELVTAKDAKNYNELSDRKKDILNAVIKTYLDTGEPVGSRTISKLEGVEFSPATIRNEMADLEELGYIYSPHTSAGRIPTDLGYRFYVDNLIIQTDRKIEDMKSLMIEKYDKMEEILKQAAKLLATNTNYASIISSPKNNKNRIKFIQMSRVEEHELLVVIVSQGNIVRNKLINIEETLNDESLLKLNLVFNTHLAGLRLEDINLGLIAKLNGELPQHNDLIEKIVKSLIESIDLEDLEVYTSGTTNILKYPEIADSSVATELLTALEEKNEIKKIIDQDVNGDKNNSIRVYIGDENSSENMKDCSIVTATYTLDDGLQSTIGIVGPKRMNYEKVMNTIQTLMSELDGIYHKKDKKE